MSLFHASFLGISPPNTDKKSLLYELEKWPEWRRRWGEFRVSSRRPYPQCFFETPTPISADKSKELSTAIVLLDGAADIAHPDLQGRVELLFKPLQEERMLIVDHATAMASIAVGHEAGFVKNVRLYSAPIVSEDKKVFEVSLVRAVEMLPEIIKRHEGRCVVVGTFVGEPSSFIDIQVEKIMALGVPVIWSAGNTGSSLDRISPVRLPELITVGASTIKDALLCENEMKTNFGSGLTLFAPGKYIFSAWSSTEKKFNLCAGTSASAMITAAAVAKKIRDGALPQHEQIKKMLIEESSHDLLLFPEGAEAPNRLLHFYPDRLRPRPPERYE